MLPAERKEESCRKEYSKGLRNQNGEHLVNLHELNNLEKTRV